MKSDLNESKTVTNANRSQKQHEKARQNLHKIKKQVLPEAFVELDAIIPFLVCQASTMTVKSPCKNAKQLIFIYDRSKMTRINNS